MEINILSENQVRLIIENELNRRNAQLNLELDKIRRRLIELERKWSLK